MRVLINGVSAVAGGGITYLANLAELLPRLAPQHQFVFVVSPGVDFSRSGSNIEIHPVDYAHMGILARLAWENFRLWEICRQEKADLLFCPANIIPLIKPGIPLVSMVRNVAPFYPQVKRKLFFYEGLRKGVHMLVLQFLTDWAVKNSDYIIYLSRATKKLIEKKNGPVPSRVLYHGVNQRFFSREERPEDAPKGDFFISVSNLYVYKGLEFLIDAMKELPELPPVLIIGKPLDLGYVDSMKKLIKKENLTDRIRFIGNIPYDELPKWYSHAKAMIYTSWCENCPNILLEAMACGCPVVAMDIGPMREICQEAAIYSRPFHAPSLGKAIKDVLAPEKNAELRKNAALRAKDFDWEKSISLLLGGFEEAFKRS